MTPAESPAATPAETHPRPQLRRPTWTSLDGPWSFDYDDSDRGTDLRWFKTGEFEQTIIVPFPPESSASGIADPGFHPIVWYSRTVRSEDVPGGGLNTSGRMLLRFGAVDYHATVWVNGSRVAQHAGGHSPFSADITDYVDADEDILIVVRAVDRPDDVGQPRGKQDWLPEPHDIWYHRTTGIWQPVWLEWVPATHITELHWRPNRSTDAIGLELLLNRPAPDGAVITVELSYEGAPLARVTSAVNHPSSPMLDIPLRHQKNGQHYDKLLWSPDDPRLIEAQITVEAGDTRDVVDSYLGLRTVGTRAGHFTLNDRPCFVRAVLEQGYWPASHLAAPSADALKEEVELIKSLGFNTARLHQKAEDPRFLYWADRLGLMIWAEAPAAYEFTTEAITRLTTEWLDLVRRDRSHPSVVTWVPLNESWGVQHISTDSAQRAFSRGIADLTRALDPTRPVISNDGWEHTRSDVLTVHDYDGDPASFAERYASREALYDLFAGYGPAGRLMMAEGTGDPDSPVMVSEFGGIRYTTAAHGASWGYSTSRTADEFEQHLRALVSALRSSPVLAGFCYTQLTDTMQEANGLTDEHRSPKLPAEVIRAIIEG